MLAGPGTIIDATSSTLMLLVFGRGDADGDDGAGRFDLPDWSAR